jgi:hypothetical protein
MEQIKFWEFGATGCEFDNVSWSQFAADIAN